MNGLNRPVCALVRRCGLCLFILKILPAFGSHSVAGRSSQTMDRHQGLPERCSPSKKDCSLLLLCRLAHIKEWWEGQWNAASRLQRALSQLTLSATQWRCVPNGQLCRSGRWGNSAFLAGWQAGRAPVHQNLGSAGRDPRWGTVLFGAALGSFGQFWAVLGGFKTSGQSQQQARQGHGGSATVPGTLH